MLVYTLVCFKNWFFLYIFLCSDVESCVPELLRLLMHVGCSFAHSRWSHRQKSRTCSRTSWRRCLRSSYLRTARTNGALAGQCWVWFCWLNPRSTISRCEQQDPFLYSSNLTVVMAPHKKVRGHQACETNCLVLSYMPPCPPIPKPIGAQPHSLSSQCSPQRLCTGSYAWHHTLEKHKQKSLMIELFADLCMSLWNRWCTVCISSQSFTWLKRWLAWHEENKLFVIESFAQEQPLVPNVLCMYMLSIIVWHIVPLDHVSACKEQVCRLWMNAKCLPSNLQNHWNRILC